MPRFLTRLTCDSVIRLNKRAYHVLDDVKSIAFKFPDANVAIIDEFVPLGSEKIPSGFLIQVEADATDIRESLQHSRAWAVAALSLCRFAGRGAVSLTKPLWSYEISPGIASREWRAVVCHPALDIGKRPIEVQVIGDMWSKLDAFMANANIKDDFKARVWRGIHAYRRSLSDNEDSLSEFLVLWTAFEGLDCVYRKSFPSRQSQFKDGLMTVLAALDPTVPFHAVEGLRDGIAHGAIDLNTAMQTAKSHMELVRNAVQFTVMRILGFDEAAAKQALSRPSVSSKFTPHFVLVGSLEIEPPPFDNFGSQPVVEPILGEVKTTRSGDKLNLAPSMSFRFLGPSAKLTVRGHELWGDKELGLSASGGATDVSVTKGPVE